MDIYLLESEITFLAGKSQESGYLLIVSERVIFPVRLQHGRVKEVARNEAPPELLELRVLCEGT
jgi:hypothetical protein